MGKAFTMFLVSVALFLGWKGTVDKPVIPCAEPIAYAIGSFDRRFNLSQKDFLSALAEAEAIWEKPSGRELFAYAPEQGELKVNLVYDYRQAVTEELSEIESVVKEDEADYRALEARYENLKHQYADIKGAYEAEVDSFEDRKSIYEQNVRKWDNSPRTSREQFEALEEERRALESLASILKTMEDRLNALVREINTLVDRLNRLARELNLNVDEYNTIGASRGETFAGGIYSKSGIEERIDIYEFESREKLVRILAHELGHALGLEHIDDQEAIMYKLNEDEAGAASASDLAALETLCAEQ